MPRVSLAMPVFNGENYINEALRSVLAQDFADFELIITDNASTDGTQEICRHHAAQDQRIRYHRHPRNLGAAPNYNSGYELAQGEFLKWCAHDDTISPNYLSACVAALDADPSLALAFGRTQCIDGSGAEISMVGHDIPPLGGLTPAERFDRVIRFSGTCFEIFGMFRMNLLKRTTLHRLYYGSDRALLAEIALLGGFVKCPDAVFNNREHQTRSINIDDKRARRLWQFADGKNKASFEHWNLILHLFEIARRHPEAAAPAKSFGVVAAFAAQPLQLSRYFLEVLAAVSPGAAGALRRTMRGANKTA